ADLFETYCVTVVATMVLASLFFLNTEMMPWMMAYPLAIGAVCILASVAGTFFVKLGAGRNIMGALYKGFIASALFSLVGIALVTLWVVGFITPLRAGPVEFSGFALFLCAVTGLVVTGLIVWVTEYYTGTD